MPYRRKKLTFAISSPDEFLLRICWTVTGRMCAFKDCLLMQPTTPQVQVQVQVHSTQIVIDSMSSAVAPDIRTREQLYL